MEEFCKEYFQKRHKKATDAAPSQSPPRYAISDDPQSLM